MATKRTEQALREAARTFAEVDGAALRAELSALEQRNIRYVTPRSDAAVAKLLRSDRRRRASRWMTAAAALLLLISIPVLANLLTKASPVQPPSDSPPAPVELLPLSFVLPSNFSVANSALDNGQSIYYLKEAMGDDVILTMEKGATPNVRQMRPVTIGGQPAYYRHESTYSLLVFEKDGILYNLSCQYESDTIAQLGENILKNL